MSRYVWIDYTHDDSKREWYRVVPLDIVCRIFSGDGKGGVPEWCMNARLEDRYTRRTFRLANINRFEDGGPYNAADPLDQVGKLVEELDKSIKARILSSAMEDQVEKIRGALGAARRARREAATPDAVSRQCAHFSRWERRCTLSHTQRVPGSVPERCELCPDKEKPL